MGGDINLGIVRIYMVFLFSQMKALFDHIQQLECIPSTYDSNSLTVGELEASLQYTQDLALKKWSFGAYCDMFCR